MLRVKRVYEPAAPGDGRRVLVDRLWPRGLRKEEARVDEWLPEVAPSAALRKWFGHDPERWDAFRERYFRELEGGEGREDQVRRLRALARRGVLTLLFAARDEAHNNAVALREYLVGRRSGR